MPIGRVVTLPDVSPYSGARVPADIEALYSNTPPRGGGDPVGPGGVQVPRRLTILPPEFVAPRQSIQFQPFATATTNAVGQVTLLWSFQVPKASVLIIKSLDLYVNDMVATTNLQFGLFVNGGSYNDYGKIPMFPQTAASVSKSFNDQTWRFTENELVECKITNNDGGTHLVGAGAQGWYYASTFDALFDLGV